MPRWFAGRQRVAARMTDGLMRLMIVVPSAADGTIDPVTIAMIRGLQRRDHEVVLVSVYDEARTNRLGPIEQHSLQDHRGKARIKPKQLAGSIPADQLSDAKWISLMASRLAELARPLAVDAVIAEGYDIARLALIAKQRLSPEMCVVARLTGDVRPFGAGAHGALEAVLLREYLDCADALLVSEHAVAAGIVEALGTSEDRISVLPFSTAIDIEGLTTRDSEQPLGRHLSVPNPPYFVSVLNAEGDRGLEPLIAAIEIACSKQPLRFLLFGARREDIPDAFADAVSCLPLKAWDPMVLEQAVAYVHPSAEPDMGVPGAVVSALMSECPVISTNRPNGIRELLEDGGPGLLVRHGDSDGLAEAMLQLVWDDEARALRASGARETLASHSFDTLVTRRVDELLARLRSRAGQPR